MSIVASGATTVNTALGYKAQGVLLYSYSSIGIVYIYPLPAGILGVAIRLGRKETAGTLQLCLKRKSQSLSDISKAAGVEPAGLFRLFLIL